MFLILFLVQNVNLIGYSNLLVIDHGMGISVSICL
jgi:hypothetical protein